MSGFEANALPRAIPIFPLEGALVLPRGHLPLNIFEPRYIEMVHDAMAGTRLIGMVQPKKAGELYSVGGVGKIDQFTDTGNGRLAIVLSGLTRFRIVRELEVSTPYRQVEADYTPFLRDFRTPGELDPATRETLEAELRDYLDARGLSADWDAVRQAGDEALVNTLASVCPFDAAEKQALLEADDLPRRAATLEALMRFTSESGGSERVH